MKVDDPDQNLGPVGEWAIRHFDWWLAVLVAVTAVWILLSVFVLPQKQIAFSAAAIYVAGVGFAVSRILTIRTLRDGRPPRDRPPR